ncbi:MAG: hypothetical protein Q8O89_06960 [Nanoarchaeota archaeon]|nr:hypothetical protein [Nanoarchaeota archaeon]
MSGLSDILNRFTVVCAGGMSRNPNGEPAIDENEIERRISSKEGCGFYGTNQSCKGNDSCPTSVDKYGFSICCIHCEYTTIENGALKENNCPDSGGICYVVEHLAQKKVDLELVKP